MPRHTVHRRDSNHDDLMKLARQLFPVVEDHHLASLGYDAIWANGRDVWVVEIKPPGRYELTPNELKAQARWTSRYRVVQDEGTVRALAYGEPLAFKPADLSPLARRPCPRWCGWEHPGHVNDPHPQPGQSFFLVKGEDDVQRARCANETHDFNPRPLPKPLSPLARRLKRRGAL